jgi:hypothetical protein
MTNKMRLLMIGLLVFCSSLITAWAQEDADTQIAAAQPETTLPRTAPTQTPPVPAPQQPAVHPVATTYSKQKTTRRLTDNFNQDAPDTGE